MGRIEVAVSMQDGIIAGDDVDEVEEIGVCCNDTSADIALEAYTVHDYGIKISSANARGCYHPSSLKQNERTLLLVRVEVPLGAYSKTWRTLPRLLANSSIVTCFT